MSPEPLSIASRLEIAEAALELAGAQATAAAIEVRRGSFDAMKRYDKLHGQIDIILNERDWLLAIAETFGQVPS